MDNISTEVTRKVKFYYGIPPMDGKIRTLAFRTSRGGDLCYTGQRFCVAEYLAESDPGEEIYAYTDELISQSFVPPYYTRLSNVKLKPQDIKEGETVEDAVARQLGFTSEEPEEPTIEWDEKDDKVKTIEIRDDNPTYEALPAPSLGDTAVTNFLIQKSGIEGTFGLIDYDEKEDEEHVCLGVAADSLIDKIIETVIKVHETKKKDERVKPLTLYKWKNYEWRLCCINLFDNNKVTPELVRWEKYKGKDSCYMIGEFEQGGNSADYEFSFKTTGSRYFKKIKQFDKVIMDQITLLVMEVLNAAVNRYYENNDRYLIFE